VAKERDLSLFMDGFPSRKAAKLDEAGGRQDAIVAQLERITKLMVSREGAGICSK
jgi:intraflagellar transport protein 74